jgi:hypothetical protein
MRRTTGQEFVGDGSFPAVVTASGSPIFTLVIPKWAAAGINHRHPFADALKKARSKKSLIGHENFAPRGALANSRTA